MDYVFQFGEVFKHFGVFLPGLRLTVLLGVSTGLLGILTGWVVALLRHSNKLPVNLIFSAYVEFWRNTPLIVQLFFVYFGITALFGFTFSAVEAGFVAILFNTTAYYAEILRGGIQAIPAIQLEAAKSVGLTNFQVIRLIIVPWTMKTVFPSLVNQFVLTMLDTAVLSVIAVPDLLNEAKELQAITGRTIEIYFVVAVIYVGLVLALSVVLRFIERRFFTLPELRAKKKTPKIFGAA